MGRSDCEELLLNIGARSLWSVRKVPTAGCGVRTSLRIVLCEFPGSGSAMFDWQKLHNCPPRPSERIYGVIAVCFSMVGRTRSAKTSSVSASFRRIWAMK